MTKRDRRSSRNFWRPWEQRPSIFPLKIECCGSFQSVGSPDVATECAHKILGSAIKNGAEVIVSTCPMCTFNIDHKQADIKAEAPRFQNDPRALFYPDPRTGHGS